MPPVTAPGKPNPTGKDLLVIDYKWLPRLAAGCEGGVSPPLLYPAIALRRCHEKKMLECTPEMYRRGKTFSRKILDRLLDRDKFRDDRQQICRVCRWGWVAVMNGIVAREAWLRVAVLATC